MAQPLDQKVLRSLVGQGVSLQGEETVAVTIAEVTTLGSAAKEAGRLPFSVLLVAEPGTSTLTQGTYQLVWDEGESPLFVVPIGPGAEGGMRYEAVFN